MICFYFSIVEKYCTVLYCTVLYCTVYMNEYIQVVGDLGQVLFCPFELKDEESIRNAVKHSNIVINLIGNYYSLSSCKKDYLVLYLSDLLQFNFRGLVPNDSILFYLRVRFTSAPLIPLSVNQTCHYLKRMLLKIISKFSLRSRYGDSQLLVYRRERERS